MEEIMKNRLILILSVLSALLLISTVSSCGSAYQLKDARNKEMARRLDLEEVMGKASAQKAELAKELKSVQEELAKEQGARQLAEEALAQEQEESVNLREELKKVNKLKEALENNLKEALVSGEPPEKIRRK